MNVTIETGHATFIAEPAHHRPVTFEVRQRKVDVSRSWGRNEQQRYVVGIKNGDGHGFAHYLSFEKACAAALARARRFEQAYSKPRGLAAKAVAS